MDQSPAIQRKLTTILAADAANYSARMQQDEVATVQALRRSRDIFSTRILERKGRIANTAGDGLIAEFPSVVDAVAAAVSIQRELEAGADLLPFRIGLHLGDVIVDGDDLLGDGVNLAARLQDMAREGGILATQQVVDHAMGRLAAEFVDLGDVRPKGFAEDLPIYAVVADGVAAPVRIEDVTPRSAPARNRRSGLQSSKRAEKYLKHRRQGAIFMGGFAALDIMSGAGFGWALWPVAAIAGLLWVSRARLSESERAYVKTQKLLPFRK